MKPDPDAAEADAADAETSRLAVAEAEAEVDEVDGDSVGHSAYADEPSDLVDAERGLAEDASPPF